MGRHRTLQNRQVRRQQIDHAAIMIAGPGNAPKSRRKGQHHQKKQQQKMAHDRPRNKKRYSYGDDRIMEQMNKKIAYKSVSLTLEHIGCRQKESDSKQLADLFEVYSLPHQLDHSGDSASKPVNISQIIQIFQ